jgi:hypothetical protein
MNRVFVAGMVSLVLALLPAAANDDFRGTRLSHFNGKDYFFDLYVSQLAKAPAWNDGDDFPPLTHARRATLP